MILIFANANSNLLTLVHYGVYIKCVMKPPRSSLKQGLLLLSRSVADHSDQEWEIDGNGAIREMAQRIQLQQGNIYSFSGNTHATYSLVYIT